MKKAVFFILALVYATILPSFAEEERIFLERAAEIEEVYGIRISHDEAGELQAEKQLGQIEVALACLGPELTRRMAAHYADNTLDGELQILITADENWESQGVGGTFNIMDNTILLFVRADSVTPAANIVHEFGHVYHWFLDPRDFAEFCEINGGKDSYTTTVFDKAFDPERYATSFASTRASEDFAETFMTMIVNGGDRPVSLEHNTKLYRKYRWIQSSLAQQLGADSLVAKRASGFLGVAAEEGGQEG